MCKRLRVGDLVDNRYRSDRGRTAQAVKKIREKNSQKSAAVSKKDGQKVWSITTRGILREDLGLYPYKNVEAKVLPTLRSKRGSLVAENSRSGTSRLISTKSDEKLFGVEEKQNS